MTVALSLGKPAANWRRYVPAHALRVLTICAMFAALLAVAINYAREAAIVMPAAGVAGAGGIAGAGQPMGGLTVGVAPDDPVARFSQSRVGHILYAPLVGDHCRRVLFYNRTGELYESQQVLCLQSVPESVLATGADRLETLRKAFQKPQARSVAQ